MDDWLARIVQGMDEEQARKIIQSVDEEEIALAIDWIIEEMVIPHLMEVRDRAQNDRPSREVRRYYEEEMDAEQREEVFWDTFDELVRALVLCREDPKEGFGRIKGMLRDPFTAEALLLIFENEDHIDPEYTAELKDFGAINLRYMGAMVVPEMYREEELRRVREKLGMSVDGE